MPPPDDTLLRPRAFRRDPPATIGAWQVRAASNELVGPGGVVRLRPRLMDVLLRLADSPGEVVTRQVLLDEVWPRRLVADEVLSRTIAELRTALSDDAREARYIETLPKIGYRLIAPVIRRPAPAANSTTAGARDGPRPASGLERPAAAVALGNPATARRGLRRARGALLVIVVAAAAITAMLLRPGAPEPMEARLQRQLNGAVPFSSDVDMEMSPRFSPDGKRVAFALGDEQTSRIVIQDVATRTREMFGAPGAFHVSPVFFPDGRRLAFFRRQDKSCAIVERDLTSGAERVLVDCSAGPAPRFDLSPDGHYLVYAAIGYSDSGLRLVELATGRVTRLTEPSPEIGHDTFPRFSHDGTRIVFLRGVLEWREIWMLSIAAPADARTVGVQRGMVLGMTWRDANSLVVAADWFGFRALNVLDVATGKAALAGARGAQFPDVAADGSLVYEAAAYTANLNLIDLADPAGPPRTLWPSSRYTNYPEYSPDGQRVVFLSNRDNTASLFIGTPGGEARRLPLPTTDFIFVRPHWSFDGRALYAVRQKLGPIDAPTGAVRIDPETGAVHSLDALGAWVTDVRDTADGRMLYFGVQEGQVMQMWRAPVDAPARREALALPKVMDYDLRGERLAYVLPREPDVTLCTVPELRCKPAGLPPQEGRMGWTLTKDALWVGYHAGEPGELVRYDLRNGSIDARIPWGPSSIGPNVAIAPDGRHAILARQDLPAVDLMLALPVK
jgi:DNA-binding winged helix-turn-helix (wHTH) protein/Tol biopolymer transport system component